VTQKPHIPSVEELARLTPGELSDLLANIVLLLRRFPDVPIGEITTQIGTGTSSGNGTPQQETKLDATALVARMRKDSGQAAGQQTTVPDWVRPS